MSVNKHTVEWIDSIHLGTTPSLSFALAICNITADFVIDCICDNFPNIITTKTKSIPHFAYAL